MSSKGAWDRNYAGLTDRDPPRPYGEPTTYQMGADWLSPAAVGLVADWGCGFGFMRNYVGSDRYWGVDGSPSPFADVVCDLTEYRVLSSGVFLRHVLEHEYDWRAVLDNATFAAVNRLCIVLFTPLADTTHQIAFNTDMGVPDIAFALPDLTRPIEGAGLTWSMVTLATATQYGVETLLFCEREWAEVPAPRGPR